MDVKYCLPIVEASVADTVARIQRNLEEYALFELWLDYLEAVDTGFVSGLCEEYRERLLFVTRRLDLRKSVLAKSLRRELLAAAVSGGALVDLDFRTQSDDVKWYCDLYEGRTFLLSYHNYEETPSDEELLVLIEQMQKYEPCMYKFSTYCGKPSDAVRLLHFMLALKSAGLKCIVLGMGEYGKLMRVFGTLWGNEFVFAPEERSGASALGQLTRRELDSVLQVLASKPSVIAGC